MAQKRTWLPTPPKPPPRPKVPDDVRSAVDEQAAIVVAKLKQRCCKGQWHAKLNWCVDIRLRWHREALYFVAVMQTPQGRPPTFETHVARMEHAGDGKFNAAVPMRRGWNTVCKNQSPEECFQVIAELIYL